MFSFEKWCELNGRRWVGAQSFEEFKKNADDYAKYRKQQQQNTEEKNNVT